MRRHGRFCHRRELPSRMAGDLSMRAAARVPGQRRFHGLSGRARPPARGAGLSAGQPALRTVDYVGRGSHLRRVGRLPFSFSAVARTQDGAITVRPPRPRRRRSPRHSCRRCTTAALPAGLQPQTHLLSPAATPRSRTTVYTAATTTTSKTIMFSIMIVYNCSHVPT